MTSLADIPFYGVYKEVSERNRQAGLEEQSQQLKQVGLLAKLQAQMVDAQEKRALSGLLSQTGGDVEAAMKAAIKSGNLAGAAKLAPILESQRKAKGTPTAIGAGGLLQPDGTVIPPAQRPEAPPVDPLTSLQKIREGLVTKYGEDHPYIKQVDSRIEVLSTRPERVDKGTWSEPYNMGGAQVQRNTVTGEIRTAVSRPQQAAVNVYSQSLTPGVDAQGNHVFVQASGRPDIAPRVVPGVYPQERPAAAKAANEAREGAATIDNIRTRIQNMTNLIQGGSMTGGVVGPLGAVGRLAETGVGVINPNTPTPALDYDNEKRLLLADVRKIIEKDPNLSNQERENLYTTLGGGMLQTPGSAVRTLNNVLQYVEGKRARAPAAAGASDIAGRVQASGWAYEPEKYDYRVVDGKVQRKAR